MTRQTTIIQNIHAPVYGHVAAGDIHAPAPQVQPADLRQPMPLDVMERQLRGVRSRLLREQVGYWINWRTVITITWMLAALSLALGSLTSVTRPEGGIGGLTAAALVLPVGALVPWVLSARRIRSYRIRQLERQAFELEREVTLRRAGLL
ncbi:MAG: hypothetical protein QM702_07610 [Rubrivivax sp.]